MSRKHRHHPGGNYVEIIEAAIESGVITTAPGTVGVFEVYHDAWCGIFRGQPCNCKPEIVHVVQPAKKAE